MGLACSTALRRPVLAARAARRGLVERVEFSAPCRCLYGSSEPGGTPQRGDPKPQFTAANKAGVQVGARPSARHASTALARVGTDAGHCLNVAAGTPSRTSLVDNRKMVVAPAITWNPVGPNTVLNHEAEFIRHPYAADRGIAGQWQRRCLAARPLPGDPSRDNRRER